MNRSLTAYRVTYHDGLSYSTNMAADVTLEQAQAYFLGVVHTDEDESGHEERRRVVKVETITPPATEDTRL